MKGQKRFDTPTMDEDTIKTLFLKAFSLLMADMLTDTTAFDEKIAATQKEINDVIALNSAYIHSHSASGDNMEEFKRQTGECDERYQKAKARLNRLQAERQDRVARSQAVNAFVDALFEQPLILVDWRDCLWILKKKKKGQYTAAFRAKSNNPDLVSRSGLICGSPGRARTYNNSVNSRVLCH